MRRFARHWVVFIAQADASPRPFAALRYSPRRILKSIGNRANARCPNRRIELRPRARQKDGRCALGSRLRGNPNGCRPESGSGTVPRTAQRATARIPDALIRCGDHPRVMFEQACHIHRQQRDGTWSFEAQGGSDAILKLPSVGLMIPLSEIYAFADLPEPGADDPAATTLG